MRRVRVSCVRTQPQMLLALSTAPSNPTQPTPMSANTGRQLAQRALTHVVAPWCAAQRLALSTASALNPLAAAAAAGGAAHTTPRPTPTAAAACLQQQQQQQQRGVRGAATKAAGAPSGKRLGLADVQHVVAVASGKGGVGKSTVAANLAVALALHQGWRVGLLDADIHGPSVPTMMRLQGEPGVSAEGLMQPLENHGVKCMSMGFFMKGDAPVVWRGPIVNNAIDRFLMGSAWGQLDVLVVDLPPGTGDAQIGLGQRLPLSGAVIVSTPQDVALLDARRGAQMFRKVHVPLLGLVENMSCYTCPRCGHSEAIFGQGGGAATAEELGMELLGQVPLDMGVRVQSDAGVPIVLSHPDSPPAQAYIRIAGRIKQLLTSTPCSTLAGGQQPSITVE